MIVLKLRLRSKTCFNLLLIFILLIFIISLILLDISEPTFEIAGIVKPSTIFQYSLFLLFCMMLIKIKPMFYKLKQMWINIFIIFSFFLLMATFFEVFWAFNYWFAIHSTINKDSIEYAIELDNVKYIPIEKLVSVDSGNMNFVTKKNTAFFFMALYFVYYLINIKYELSRNRL